MAATTKDFREVTDAQERQQHLARTGLDIQLTAYEPGQDVFLAAHNSVNSVLALRLGPDLTVWFVQGDSKLNRTLLADRIRHKLTGGKPQTHTPS